MAQKDVYTSHAVLHPVQEAQGRPPRPLDAIDGLPDALLCIDEDGHCTYLNDAAARLCGGSRAELLGRPIAAVLPPAIAALLKDAPAGSSGSKRPVEFEVVLPSGETYEAQWRPIPGGHSVYLRDISAVRELETELRQAEDRFRTAFNQMPMALTLSSLETGHLLDVNETMLELSGYTREEVLGRTSEEIGLWVDPDIRAERFAALREGRRPPDAEATFRSKNGDINSGIIASTVVEMQGRPCVLSCVVDISERKRAEQTAMNAVRQLRLIADHAAVMIASFDYEGRIKFVNRPYAERFGRQPEELVGKHISEVVGDAAYALIEGYADEIRSGREVEFEMELPYKVGGPQFMRCAYRPERDEEGRVVGLVASISNITDRKRIEQALRDAHRRKDEFLASLAHELRNPLAPLSNGLEIMRLAPDDKTAVEQARDMMERQLSQLVRLVDDLLDVSRISRDKIELRRAPTTLAGVVDGAVEICRPAIRNAGLNLRISLPPQPVWLDADKVRLVQVISNLLNNAAKFTPHGGRIDVQAECVGEEVLIRVRDTGIGIPPELLGSIFDLFVQADRSLERTQVGLGVGLTIVKRLVELHGGRVEAHSEGANQGSEFLVWLPVTNTPPAAEPLRAARPGELVRRRILLVDDNRDAALSLAIALRLLNHEVRIAYDGLEALSLGETFHPEIVFLDIGMPKLNGYDTARELRTRAWGQKTVLVALTGFGQTSDRAASVEAGFDHHLVKPADMDALRAILAAIPEASQK